MKKVLPILIVLPTVLIFSTIFPIYLVGGVIKDKDYYNSVDCLLKNARFEKIIYAGADKPFIGLSMVTPISRYYIEDIGTIPYWSKMDTRISEWLDSVKKENHKKLINSMCQ